MSGAVGNGPREVTVIVPATSANLGPGFDALGLALSLHDEVRVRIEDAGSPQVTLHVTGEGADAVPRDASHLVVRSMLTTYDRLGLARPHLTMWCTNRIPHGRGLGSSAAAAVAGVLAARALTAAALDDDGVLGLATEIEGHPDNAAAALLGGLTIAWTEGASARAVCLEPAPSVRAVVFVPDAELATEKARGLLPASVPHADAAHAAGRAALLVAAMTSRPDLLLAATEDRLHQAYREPAMPGSLELVGRLRAAGVAAVVSGAGPSVLALTSTGGPVPDEGLAAPGFRLLDVDVAARGAQVSVPDGG